MKKYTIGIDIGGTNIKLGLIKSGKVIDRKYLSTGKYLRNKNSLITALVSAVNELTGINKVNAPEIQGIGIGLPGLIDNKNGIVIFLPNIPGWHNVPLKKIMENNLKIPVFLDNDVNMIALGEWKYGAGKGVSDMICITLGTGVGGGLILNNALYRGKGFAAGEVGHIPLNEKGQRCNCGGYGCLETYVGKNFLDAKSAKIFKRKGIDLKEVSQLAEAGNSRAKDFWTQTAVHLGNGLVGVVNLLNPQLLVLGGGVSNSYFFLKPALLKVLKTRTMKVQSRMLKVSKCKLGDDAGIIGADVLVRSELD
ncbi:MAG: ROK family protein [Candidatus Omnitrophica bacterium]|nr:ROK family protein [Candidatus Omnitrophota bacterium]